MRTATRQKLAALVEAAAANRGITSSQRKFIDRHLAQIQAEDPELARWLSTRMVWA